MRCQRSVAGVFTQGEISFVLFSQGGGDTNNTKGKDMGGYDPFTF